MQKQLTEVFDVDSVLKTLLLCIVTLGCYLIYKLYHFSKQINQHTELKRPQAFITTSIALFVISFISLLYGIANIDDLTILQSSIGIHMVSSIFDVTWINNGAQSNQHNFMGCKRRYTLVNANYYISFSCDLYAVQD